MANPFMNWLSGGGDKKSVAPFTMGGTMGTNVSGGYVHVIEVNPLLQRGQRELTTADILANCSIVAAGMRYFLNLVANPTWKVEPAEDQPDSKDNKSSDAAKKAAELLEDMLYDLETSWVRVVRRSGMYRFHGFGIQEWQAKRRDDGYIGLADIQSRPVHTVERWDLDEQGKINGIWQRSPFTSQEIYLPRSKIVYMVDDTLSDSPEGFGLFRNIVEPAERVKNYKLIEANGFERDFRGVPIGRAPLGAINEQIDAGTIQKADGIKLIAGIKNFITMRAKGEQTGLLLDSRTYESQGADSLSPTATPMWGMELLTGSSTGIEHVGTAIGREVNEIARILGVESLLMGESSGNRALSEDKSKNLYLTVNSCITDLGESFDKDIVDTIWRLNGLPQELKPWLKAEDVSFKSVSQITAALRDMATAGAVLDPNDPAINDVRDLLGISEAPEYDPAKDPKLLLPDPMTGKDPNAKEDTKEEDNG